MSAPPDTSPSEHRWPWRALAGDYLRAAAGFAVCFPPLLYVAWTIPVVIILGGLSALFLWLAARTVMRHRAVIRADIDGIRWDNKRINWADLDRVTARRFGARRKDGSSMDMTLAGAGTRFTIDSTLSDFVALARRIHAQARARGIAFDARTRDAFAALDLTEAGR